MLLNNRIIFLICFAFLMPLFVQAQNNTADMVSFTYEEYGNTSYAISLRTIKYKLNKIEYVIVNKESININEDIPHVLDKRMVDEFLEAMSTQRKSENIVKFSPNDVDDCLAFMMDTQYSDIPMILSFYEMDKDYLTDQLPLLCSADNSKMQTLLDSLYKTKRKPFFSILLKMHDGTTINVYPNSFYEGDNWYLKENSFIRDSFVTSFLKKVGLNMLFVPLEKEYMMIELIGINKKYKIIEYE